MKLGVITPWVSRLAGGLFESVKNLTLEISQKENLNCKVFGLKDQFVEVDLPTWHPLEVSTSKILGYPAFGWSPSLRKDVNAYAPDILHVHGLWMYTSYVSLKYYKRVKAPYIVSPRGMLDPWAVQNSSWKKKIVGSLFEFEHLRKAKFIHALNDSEAESVRKFGLKTPICIIPNGVYIPDLSKIRINPFPNGKRILLYLGRIHPKKGLTNLLKAWSIIQNEINQHNFVLAIAGWDQGNYEAELKKIVQENKMSESVIFLGSRYGEAKEACYQHCTGFILPSFSEGLPMTVLEAWSFKKPVLMTKACNLPDGFSENASIEIDPNDINNVCSKINEFMSLSKIEIDSIGNNALELVKKKYTWSKIAVDMAKVYQSL